MDAKGLALRLFFTLSTLGSLPGGRLLPHESHPLYAVGASAYIPTGYGLGIVGVPPPPADLALSPPAGASCPVEIRAIITADVPQDTFVVVAVGSGNALLLKGQGVRTEAGWVSISEIAADHVVLYRGGDKFDCTLGSAAALSPPVAAEPER